LPRVIFFFLPLVFIVFSFAIFLGEMDYLLSRKHYYEISELTALIHSLLTLFAFTLKVRKMMRYTAEKGEAGSGADVEVRKLRGEI
jgi:hypothetical protein